jgi:hypothetical protein
VEIISKYYEASQNRIVLLTSSGLIIPAVSHEAGPNGIPAGCAEPGSPAAAEPEEKGKGCNRADRGRRAQQTGERKPEGGDIGESWRGASGARDKDREKEATDDRGREEEEGGPRGKKNKERSEEIIDQGRTLEANGGRGDVRRGNRHGGRARTARRQERARRHGGGQPRRESRGGLEGRRARRRARRSRGGREGRGSRGDCAGMEDVPG